MVKENVNVTAEFGEGGEKSFITEQRPSYVPTRMESEALNNIFQSEDELYEDI